MASKSRLPLPFPVKKERQIECFLISMDHAKCPTQFKVTVPKNGCMRDLCKALSTLSGVNSNNMIVTEVYNHKFHKIFGLEEALHNILPRDDIFVYEVPTTDVEHRDIVIAPIYHREKMGGSMTSSPWHLFGQPLLIGLPKSELTYETLYEHVLGNLSRYVNPPAEGMEWWKTNNESGQAVNSDPANNMDFMEEDDLKGPPKLFALNLVNSYGNSQIIELVNDGNPIKIKSMSYIGLDWHPRAKELFYNEKEAEEFAQDESYHGETSHTAKKRKYFEETLENLECSVCQNIASPPIKQCQNGHITCNMCIERINNCPVCRAKNIKVRNLFADKTFASLPLPCINAEYGCKTRMASEERKHHEEKCPFRPFNCPSHNCMDQLAGSQVDDHLKQKHGRLIRINGSKRKTQFELPKTQGTGANYYYPNVFYCFNETFFVSFAFEKGTFFALVRVLGDDPTANKYEYEVTIWNDKRQLKYSASEVHSLRRKLQEIIDTKDCFMIPMAHQFKNEYGRMNFKIELFDKTREAAGVEKIPVNACQ